jgi:CheY-like chemotaxis protein
MPKILMVENDPSASMSTALEFYLGTDYEVITAFNSKQASDIIKDPNFKIDAIVSDVNLGRGDSSGVLVMKALRAYNTLKSRKKIPFILMGPPEYEKIALRERSNAFFSYIREVEAEEKRPTPIDELGEAILKVLDK